MKQISLGLRCFLRAPALLSTTRMWRWVVAPGIVLMLGVATVAWATWNWFLDFATWLPETMPTWAQHPMIVGIAAAVAWALGVFAALFLLLQLLMIAWAPVFGYVSETIDAHLEGARSRPFALKHVAEDLWRALKVTAKSVALWLVWIVFSLLLVLVPVIGGPLSLVALLLTNGYFATVGYLDSCLERRRFSIQETFDYAAQHRLAMLSIGLGFSLCLMIPLIGWIIAPGLAVAASTAYCVASEEE